MATKTSTLCILIIIGIASIYSTCKKESIGCANTVYYFKIGAKIYPDKEIINLGDTLWIEIISPTSLRDIYTDKIVDYAGAANLGSAIGFGKFTDTNAIADAANSFQYILKTGTSVSNSFTFKIREYLFAQQGQNYFFKLGLIPHERGVFGFGFSNAANVYRVSDNCTKALIAIEVENTHQHYYLNPNINPANFDTTRPTGTYYFKVN